MPEFPPQGELEVRAPAKLNLGLGVLAKRGDGFHQIDTLMVKLTLHDELQLRLVDGPSTLEVRGAALPTNEDNLALRAAHSYLQAAGVDVGVAITLHKRIPIAAGLGGGSSDAAAVLRGLQQLLPGDVDLPALAAELGSDVPFFVADMPAARAQGRGEKLEPVSVAAREVVLVNPGVPVRAADAYAQLQNFSPRLPLAKIVARLAGGDEPGYFNALQAGVALHHPEVRAALQALRRTGLTGVLMSGSGATCFGLANDAAHAQAAAAELAASEPGWWVAVSRFAGEASAGGEAAPGQAPSRT